MSETVVTRWSGKKLVIYTTLRCSRSPRETSTLPSGGSSRGTTRGRGRWGGLGCWGTSESSSWLRVCLESSRCYSSAGYRLSPRHECLLEAAFCRPLQVASEREHGGMRCFKLSAHKPHLSLIDCEFVPLKKKKEKKREQSSLS